MRTVPRRHLSLCLKWYIATFDSTCIPSSNTRATISHTVGLCFALPRRKKTTHKNAHPTHTNARDDNANVFDVFKLALRRFSLVRTPPLVQDAARDRPLNLLFQVIKRSKTRGDVKMTLRVGPTSLDRVDGERLQHRVSSLPLLSVEKVYLFTDDATQVWLCPLLCFCLPRPIARRTLNDRGLSWA